MQIRQYFQWLVGAVLMAVTVVASAQGDPRQVVIETVDRITERIEEERQRLEKEPDYAEQLVREELADLVDFKRITRMVMGDYFGQSSRDQKYAFLDVFKQSLIETYASGVTLYNGQQINTLPMRDNDRRGDYARVRMQLTTNAGKVVPVFYTLYLSDGQWRVINVYVNGLDLRDTFRRQFAQSMERYNDIDQVIANWEADSRIDTGLEEKVEEASQENGEQNSQES